jgi:transmembrane sensor
MNPSLSGLNPAAEDQAALWAARLDGSSLSVPDRAELDAWLAAHPAHRALLSRYCQFSADLEQPLAVLVDAGSVKLPAMNSAPRSRWLPAWLTVGALAAAAAITVAVWIRSVPAVENFVAPIGQRQTVTLRDGTQVELNAHTSLVVQNGGAERHVRLADGEAFFSVAKDPAHPFIVETPGGSVRVTGTHFNVRSRSASELEVTVAEGSVQVRASDVGGTRPVAPVALTAGDRLITSAGSVVRQSLSPGDLDDLLAWRTGIMVFHGTPLQEAVDRFAHYHGLGITLSAAAAAADKHVGGRYSLDDLDGFLRSLGDSSLGLRVNRDPGGNYIVQLRDERR